ncbi:hypothetical protein GcM3_192008 [Golovinomyces cichoracearum]|uniref:Uncharacterized protein n=1 Tax=Golovinomyces cichoracearum TaxID=62708 RepID=A0A420HHI3_9PEZI|nr:hypothetical protein GcM3_192008 [Golovinomyces cichoracearum]
MSKSLPDKIILNSDDDGDSDSSLEDLAVFIAKRNPRVRTRRVQRDTDLSTENSSIAGRLTRPKMSPGYEPSINTKPKYKYDLISLAQSAQGYDATEASSNRVGEIIESQKLIDAQALISDNIHFDHTDSNQINLLKTVEVCGDGILQDSQRVKQAIERTESNSVSKRWYFFESQVSSTKLIGKPFPITYLTGEWKKNLENAQMREYAFVSGFVEDMVVTGKLLPDEIFLWLIEQVSLQESDILRKSYINVLTNSNSQIKRLMGPELIAKIFLYLKSTCDGTTLKKRIQPSKEIPDYYSSHDWSPLLCILTLFSRVAVALLQEVRTHLTCILLRMSVDNIVLKNVDILDSFQKTINSICKSVSSVDWEQFCKEICENIIYCVEQQTFRLQIVESISSVLVRSHELKRRLACCFLFNDLRFATAPSQNIFNFNTFIDRLKSKDLQVTHDTNYYELRALIMLMDIAVDDGRSSSVDLNDQCIEDTFNNHVDNFSMSIKEILGRLKTQDTGYVSKIQAVEAIEAFSQRVIHTMRTKPKPVHEWFVERGKRKNALEQERRDMESFVAKMRSCK